MNRSYWYLVLTQWFTAFADNAVFFALVGLASERGIQQPDQYMSAVQTAFSAAYILFAPLVGTLAERHSRKRILQLGNGLKLLSVLLLFTGLPVPICYAIFGAGAVVYSPAKYGMLNDLIPEGQLLLRGNGVMEGLSILAIMTGSVTGGILADQSSVWGIGGTGLVIVLSLLASIGLPMVEGSKIHTYRSGVLGFRNDLKQMFGEAATGLALTGNAAFWMSAALLRVAYLSWLPMVLNITDKTSQAALLASSAIGVIIGALLAPVIVRYGNTSRAIPFAYITAILIIVTPWLVSAVQVAVVLGLIGCFGGLFVVPMNTLLQAEGKKRIGVGRTIAIQNMTENLFMLVGLAGFQAMAWAGADLSVRMMAGGAVMFVLVSMIEVIRRRKLR